MTSEESYERMEQRSAHSLTQTKKRPHEEETEQKAPSRLTKGAFKEHNREKSYSKAHASSLERFARGGGPDLRDLRGHPEPLSKDSPRAKPGQGRIPITPCKRQASGASTADASERSMRSFQSSSEASTAYTAGFGILLKHANVQPPTFDQNPVNLQVWMDAIEEKGPSPLGSDAAISAAYRRFQRAFQASSLKGEVMMDVFPAIHGGVRYPSAVNRISPNLADLTDDKLPIPKPNYMEGCEQTRANRRLRDVLSPFIVFADVEETPFAPNLFTEILGNSDRLDVAQRRARYNGALGARGIHMMLNVGKDTEVFDGKAYTVTFTYYMGFLQMYLNFVVPTEDPKYPKCYQMAKASSWALDNLEGFRDGVKAYRKAQDLAHELREEIVRQAVATADQMSDEEYRALVKEAEKLKLKGRRGFTSSFDGEEATTI